MNRSRAIIRLEDTIAASERIPYMIQGRTMLVRALTSGADLYLQVGEDPETLIKAGDKFHLNDGQFFTSFALRNAGASDAVIELVISDGDVDNVSFNISGTVAVNSGDTLTNPAAVSVGVAATALAALDTTRNTVEIFNNDATKTLYIGGSDVTTAKGRPVLAQTSIALDTGAAVYGICSSGTIDARILELSD